MTDPTATQPLAPGAPSALDAWTALFTDLDRDGVPSAAHLAAIATEDVRFRDPFNDLRGIEPLRRLLAHTREQLPGARFEVLDSAWSRAHRLSQVAHDGPGQGDRRLAGGGHERGPLRPGRTGRRPPGPLGRGRAILRPAAPIGPLLRWLGRPARVV